MTGLALPLPLLAALAASFVGLSFLLLRTVEHQDKVRARLANAMNPAAATVAAPRKSVGPLELVARLGGSLARSGLLPAATRADLENTLLQAGWRGGRGLGLFLGSKAVLMLTLPLIAYVATGGGSGVQRALFYALMGAAFAIGMLLPDFILKQLRARHVKACERGLPDALDMMVICAQAGLALESAIERVAVEFEFANKSVSQELGICASELRLGSDRRAALLGLGERTGLDSMKRFGSTLIQTLQFGTPLTQALRVLASEMRADNLTKFEERAARLPVFLTFPMILFILPVVFIVVGGPSGVRIAGMFANMKH